MFNKIIRNNKPPVLGISLYPEQEDINDIKEYIKLAARYGFSKIFTSMFSIEGTIEQIVDYFKNLCKIAHDNNMVVSGDCNPMFLEKLNANANDISIFKEMGIDIIRMDVPYFDERDVTLINNNYGIKIEISSMMIDAIEKAIDKGANRDNIATCHNFYPQRYSGNSLKFLKETNKYLHNLGVTTALFISSNNTNTHGPWPVNDGLVTYENDRDIPIDLQVARWIAIGDVDELIIGNAFASEKEFKLIKNIIDNAYINLKKDEGLGKLADFLPCGQLVRIPFKVILENDISEVEKDILFNFKYHNSSEQCEYMIRSRMSRIFYKDKNITYRGNNHPYFHKGDVVIVNDNLSYYKGEVQIITKDIKNDGQRNLLGHIDNNQWEYLDEVNSGDLICFIEQE